MLGGRRAAGEAVRRLAEIEARLERIESKIDGMWAGLDAVQTRGAAYLGDGVALTHLIDGSRFFVNALDYGGPVNYIDGGRYEEHNVEILQSFVHDRTVFVDIGANLGFFSVRLGRMLRPGGARWPSSRIPGWPSWPDGTRRRTTWRGWSRCSPTACRTGTRRWSSCSPKAISAAAAWRPSAIRPGSTSCGPSSSRSTPSCRPISRRMW